MKVFAEKILVHEEDNTPEETGDNKDSGSNEDNEKEKGKMRSSKDTTLRETTVDVAANCDDVVEFLSYSYAQSTASSGANALPAR